MLYKLGDWLWQKLAPLLVSWREIVDSVVKFKFIALFVLLFSPLLLLAQGESLFIQEGTASYYASKFQGRRTASGEVYVKDSLTAAHKLLPFGTILRVTNQKNGKTVLVQVNDRLPGSSKRVIDLSYAAAVKLGFSESGTAKVLVEAIDASVPLPATDEKAYLQIGAFDNPESAIKFAGKLDHQITAPIGIKAVDSAYKVLVGPFENPRELLLVKQTLRRESNISAFAVNR